MHPVIYLARHAETVFNVAGRMQGAKANTPLTRRGIAQAEAMGAALAAHFGPGPDVDLWASPTGRTQQTAAWALGWRGGATACSPNTRARTGAVTTPSGAVSR